MDMKYVADRIVRLRMKKGLSDRALSLQLGRSPGYINNIENGRRSPSMESFFEICRALDISPQDFFPENKEPGNIYWLMRRAHRMRSTEIGYLQYLIRRMKHRYEPF